MYVLLWLPCTTREELSSGERPYMALLPCPLLPSTPQTAMTVMLLRHSILWIVYFKLYGKALCLLYNDTILKNTIYLDMTKSISFLLLCNRLSKT